MSSKTMSSKNINIRGNNVNVQPSASKRRRNKKKKQKPSSAPVAAISGVMKPSRPAPPPPPGASRMAQAPPGGGRMTQDPVTHQICGEELCPSESALGWYYKYMDPAGAVESGRALGEFSKIPDGLLRYSVDAEQRTVNTEEAPSLDSTAIPLSGSLWSASIISFPCFRLNYIIIANLDNNSMTPEIINTFLSTVNNMVNWRDNVTGAWIEFANRWYYKIRVHPNTYDMTDAGDRTDSVTQFRLSFKGVTTEFNSPTLLDQGWWVGGHVPIKPRIESIPASGSVTEGSATITVAGLSGTSPPLASIWNFGLPPLSNKELTLIGTGNIVTTGGADLSFQMRSGAVGSGASFELSNQMSFNGQVWAEPGDVISVVLVSSSGTSTANVVNNFALTNTTNDAIPPIPLVVNGFGQAFVSFVVGQAFEGFNRLSLDMPALTPDQLIVNNPKIEQFMCKESGGSYLVHYKMANPVFEMTGEENFGAFRFHYPGYNQELNADSLRGIIDTWENNFTTAICHFQGISTSASLVVKTYMGWEGTTNSGGTLGQFAHTGLDAEPELLLLAEKLQEDLTGVYEEDDNIAATIALIAGNALSNLMKGEATSSVIKGVANSALGVVKENPSIIGTAIKGIGSIGARLVNAIKNRRKRRGRR